jgi:hypothetical protein
MRLTFTAGSVPTPPDALPWLHIAVLDDAAGAGIFIAGWLADAARAIASLTIAPNADARAIELSCDDCATMTRDFADLFGAPPGLPQPRAFLAWLPGAAHLAADGARLEVHYRDGAIEHCHVPVTGHFTEIGRMFEIAAIGDAVELAKRLLARGEDARGAAIPLPITAWLARLHRRMGTLPGIKTAIEEAITVEDRGILLRFRLPVDDEPLSMMLVSFGGRRVVLEMPLPAIPADQRGIEASKACAIFAAIPGLRSNSEEFWFVEAAFGGGCIERVPLQCRPAPPPLRGIEAALALMTPLPREPEAVLRRAVAPAVAGFWAGLCRRRQVQAEAMYGRVAASPLVSVVIALGDQVDHMRHQIAQFSNDAEFCSGSAVELVYVIDDLLVNETLTKMVHSLNEVYGVPLRTIAADCVIDAASGGNIAAAAAAGRVLLFLGAAVLPKRAGWVGELLRAYQELANCGVLGCRLLAEDGSIRHGGASFRRVPTAVGGWEEHCPRAGMPSRFDRAGKCRDVLAVSGACLMIEATLFRRLGGFSEDYVCGGFADFDLCCAARQDGRRVYYTPDVELYQLADPGAVAQTRWQGELDLYNRWQYSRKWMRRLPGLLAQCTQ